MNDDFNQASAGDLTAEDRVIANLLWSHQPVLAPRFRGKIARRMVALDPGYGSRPARLWATAIGLGAIGALLMVVGAVAAGLF